uniref:Chalcone and stilbene synthase domain-containing protein n=1 Tax=Pseudenhygromyxa salsuginis TaxID=442868 RepID=A0A3S7UWM1_9BACT|nr:chalcone and stilbene synthase domain-containing protein [Pseudenhygromyxa salsuginis]
MTRAHIAGIATWVPKPYSTERFIEIDREMRSRHGHDATIADMAASFARNTGIRRRHSLHPAWHGQEADGYPDIMTSSDFDPELWQRHAFFCEHAPKIAIEAARAAIADWGGSVADISHVITTTTSGWKEPGLACAIIDALGLGEHTAKAELNFNGCFCGATCLRMARDTILAGESKAVLVVAMESASTLFEFVDPSVSTLLANALFGDGAAAVVLAPEGRWCFERSGASVVPGTRKLLTFTPPLEPGRTSYDMYLDRNVGKQLAHYLGESGGRPLLDAILDYAKGRHPALAVHPGGPNILEAVQAVFESRGWPEDCLASSFHTLHEFGNMGSAAMLFVLANTLPTLDGDTLATFAFGPGVTVEWGYYRRT